MAKILQEPSTILYPLPAAMISCADAEGQPNIITLAWVGTVASAPPQVAIGVRPSRHSHRIIAASGEFVVNIPSASQLHATDYCGSVSGREVDKFAACGLTPGPASKLKYAPIIAECPANIECKVAHSLNLGSHTLFIGQVVAVQVEESVLDEEGQIDYQRARPFAYVNRNYYALGDLLGQYGLSVRK